MRQGKVEEALALYRQELSKSPDSPSANNAAGVALDLLGRGSEARRYFGKAIEASASPQAKAMAQRGMAMSYAFDGDCANTVKYEQQVFDYYVSTQDGYQQGEIADEAARVCIDAGDLDTAERWYRTGYQAGLKQTGIPPERVSLWNFRWEHAQARLAARRGNLAEAQKHAAAAKAVLEKDSGMAESQAVFFPYLTGYIAFYGKDYKAAVEDLQKANQTDPFIQSLLGQSYEKVGRKRRPWSVTEKQRRLPRIIRRRLTGVRLPCANWRNEWSREEQKQMKHYVQVVVIALAALAPLAAQAPKGWKMRVDRSAAGVGPGRCRGSSSSSPWDRASTRPIRKRRCTGIRRIPRRANYTLKGTFTLMKPSGHTNYYGLVFGGSGLEGRAAEVSVLRGRAEWHVADQAPRRRREPSNVSPKTPNDAVKKPDASGKSTNALEVRVGADKIDFVVNGDGGAFGRRRAERWRRPTGSTAFASIICWRFRWMGSGCRNRVV